MSLVVFPTHRRRQFLLGALTVLLHLIAFRWIAVQLGQPAESGARGREAPAEAQLVQVRPDPPRARPQPAPPQPTLAPPPPLPELDPEPVDGPAPAPGDTAGAGAAAGESVVDGGSAPGGDDVAAAAVAAGAQAGGAAPPQPPQPQPQPQPQPAGPHYKIDLPPSADMKLDVVRVDANGARWKGEETLSWTLGPDSYAIRIEAGLNVMFAHVNLLTLTSEGRLGDEGFIPTLMTEKRRGRSLTATHFGRDTNLLTFSASQARYGLVPYAQDKASLPLQLAAIARGDPQQLSGKLEFVVGEDRDASVFSFTVVGQEEIETRLGRIATWHLVRPPKPGSYSSRLDLWLAPDHGWYPVQIRNVEANGATTTQTVSSIVTKNQAGK